MAKAAKAVHVNDDSAYAEITEGVVENKIVEDEHSQTVEQSELETSPKPKASAKIVSKPKALGGTVSVGYAEPGSELEPEPEPEP
jgi:hypothetical protein